MGRLSEITLLDGNSYDFRASAIPYGKVDATSTATVFTATVKGVTELTDGVCVMLENGVVTSASGFTLNVNNLGAKPCYTNLAAETRDTTIFNIAYTMLFVYDSSRGADGGWICYRGYDANTNTIGYQVRTNSFSLPMSSVTYRYRLLFTSADGDHFVPANNSTSTNATAKRTTIQEKIDPFGQIVYYGTTASVASGSRPAAANLWSQYTLNLGYSFNRTGAALVLTLWKAVYIKCEPQEDGSAIIDAETPFVQDLPTTEDGMIYIMLGVAYSATNIELLINHPVYYFKDGSIRQWTNASDSGSLEGVKYDNVALVNSDGYALLTSDTITSSLFAKQSLIYPLMVSGSTAALYDYDNLPCSFSGWLANYNSVLHTEIVRPLTSSAGIVFDVAYLDRTNQVLVLYAIYNGELHVASLEQASGATALTGTYSVTTIGSTYTAGNGIDITNGVISVSYPNGDIVNY